MSTEWRVGRSGVDLVNCMHFGEEVDSSAEYEDFDRSLADKERPDEAGEIVSMNARDACLDNDSFFGC